MGWEVEWEGAVVVSSLILCYFLSVVPKKCIVENDEERWQMVNGNGA